MPIAMALRGAAFRCEVMAGNRLGTGGRQVGTSGTGSGTSGAPRWAMPLVALLLLLKGVVDAESIADRTPELATWQPYTLELTSAAFFMALLWPLWRLSRRLRPPRLAWPVAAAAHLALLPLLVLLHAAWLDASRRLLFAAHGRAYRFDWTADQLLFEARKDVLTLVALLALGWLFDRLFAPAAPTAVRSDLPPFRLAIKDGGRTLFLAAEEISHASTAGNYVELATVHGPLLHRVTMAALADELAPHGFVRIHRAHLVRAAAVRSIASEGSGDFRVMLADGTSLPGSRRYRAGLASRQ
ncbi:LytTR family DNA-binding domain-containing protein [Sandarakinorhabdus cyanobacteriorum]|nr:LytTR family DNA-binding domain-containing protein [Sandarakinorhabdus cyanobacteriorum]